MVSISTIPWAFFKGLYRSVACLINSYHAQRRIGLPWPKRYLSRRPCRPRLHRAAKRSVIRTSNETLLQGDGASVEHHCDDNPNSEKYPDALVGLFGSNQGLSIHDGSSSFFLIRNCPWCGTAIQRQKGDQLSKLLFTVVLEYADGTYISQVRATNRRAALHAWLWLISKEKIPGIGKLAIQTLQHALTEDEVEVNGLKNVWCISCSLRRGLALINVVQTDALAGQNSSNSK